jgi:hypothetical protein
MQRTGAAGMISAIRTLPGAAPAGDRPYVIPMKKSIRDAVEISSLEIPGLGTVKAGLKVLHPIFGRGTVVAIFEFPPASKVRHSIGIEFDDVGYKPLAPEYARLQLDRE